MKDSRLSRQTNRIGRVKRKVTPSVQGGSVCFWSGSELIFGNYLKLFIDELFAWPSTALKQTEMKENQKLINEQNT